MAGPVSTETALVPQGLPIAKQAITPKHALMHQAAINFADVMKAKSVMIATKKDRCVPQTPVRPHVLEAQHFAKVHALTKQRHMSLIATTHPLPVKRIMQTSTEL